MKWSDAYEHSGWGIWVPVKLIHAIGAKGAILVAQLFYWMGKEKSEAGWIYKTKEELEKETGLSRHEQNTCVEDLKKKKVLETKYDRLDHRLYYKICKEALDDIMETDRPSESRKADLVLNQRIPSEKTTEKTTRTRAQSKATPRTSDPVNVVVVSLVESIAEEFKLSAPQKTEVQKVADEKGAEYIVEKADIVKSEPRKNLAGAFMTALRKDWKAPVSNIKPPVQGNLLTMEGQPVVPQKALTREEQAAADAEWERLANLWMAADSDQKEIWLGKMPSDAMIFQPKHGERPGLFLLTALKAVISPANS